jgi:serine phosphatase RsbU (regulator of sigma subunit)
MDDLQTPMEVPSEYHQRAEAVLEAVEQLGEELTSKDPEDMSFTVGVPEEPPAVKVLAELINEMGTRLDTYHNNLTGEILDKSQQLVEAYNSLQEKNEDVQSELNIARKIQQQLIPTGIDFPQLEEISFGGYYESMDNIGGDIYDVIRFGKNVYGLLIADVSGHGIPAALITALLKIAFRSKARYDISPKEVCEQVNADLLPILSELDFFVTAYFALINLENGQLRYCNCGHHPALLCKQSDNSLLELDSEGMLLGTFDNFEVQEQSHQAEAGDVFFFFYRWYCRSSKFQR